MSGVSRENFDAACGELGIRLGLHAEGRWMTKGADFSLYVLPLGLPGLTLAARRRADADGEVADVVAYTFGRPLAHRVVPSGVSGRFTKRLAAAAAEVAREAVRAAPWPRHGELGPKRSCRIYSGVTERERERIEAFAASRGMRMPDLVRLAVARYVEAGEAEATPRATADERTLREALRLIVAGRPYATGTPIVERGSVEEVARELLRLFREADGANVVGWEPLAGLLGVLGPLQRTLTLEERAPHTPEARAVAG
jgi:hypothetical protein